MMQARIAIETQDIIRPLTKTLEQAVKVGTGENCKGGDFYDCLVRTNWNGRENPFETDCAD